MAENQMRDECKVLFEGIRTDLTEIKTDVKSMVGNGVCIKILWALQIPLYLGLIGLIVEAFIK